MRRMRFKSNASDQVLEIGLARGNSGQSSEYHAEIDGRKIDIDAVKGEDGRGWIRSHGRTHEYFFIRTDHQIQIWLGGRTYTLELQQSGARRAGHENGSDSVRNEITAPMPGTILKVNVAPGQHFEAHSPLVIMESMKMEMTLTAPHEGRVKDVLCKVGQLVEMGTVLVRLNQ